MKIIGHRGAAGLAPENTILAIKAGIEAGADAVEFDVRQTKDGVFVLHHDLSLTRTTGKFKDISDLTVKELSVIPTYSGEPFPTLDKALAACGTTTAVIEAKGSNWAEPLAKVLSKKLHDIHAAVISFDHKELEKFHALLPGMPTYALENRHAVHAIRHASEIGFTGVDLKYYLLNPFTYMLAKLLKVELVIYTVDTPWFMRCLIWLYPGVAITTNRPDLLKKIIKATI